MLLALPRSSSTLLAASSNSTWALRYFDKLRAAISSACSICFLNALILLSSELTWSCKRAWFFLSSSDWAAKSLRLFSAFLNWLVVDVWLLASLSLSASNSAILASYCAMTRLPPLLLFPSASFNLACKSAICCKRLLLALSELAAES